MDQYVTGAMIKRLREKKELTQQQLAEKINVSDKAISKWENGRGYPDISQIEPLSNALGVSVIELFSGTDICNNNRSANILRSKLYVCPICGNVIQSLGEAVISCCGLILPALKAETPDEAHEIDISRDADEYYISVQHEMSKKHYISFIAVLKDNGYEIIKLYPEGNAEARIRIHGTKRVLCYCNKHGLFQLQIKQKRQ